MRKYCPDCGTEMILKPISRGYDADTGKPLAPLWVEAHCPNERWWKGGCYDREFIVPAEPKLKEGKWP